MTADRQTGDAALAADVRMALGPRPGTHAVAVAIVEPDGVRMAGLGDSGDPAHPHVDASSAFEIGSITKALNGMLLATLSDDGVVGEDTRVCGHAARTRGPGSRPMAAATTLTPTSVLPCWATAWPRQRAPTIPTCCARGCSHRWG